MEYKNRYDYLDFCKVFAMFLVTTAHCAQCLSGEQFPSLAISRDSFISFNMAIFMIASGYVINIKKMEAVSIKEYLLSKTIRLLLPMTTWYLVICIISRKTPTLSMYWLQYWYLGALFVCLSTIKLLTSFISRLSLLCVVSIIIICVMPSTFFERSCYMIPFLWIGFYLKKLINKMNFGICLCLLFFYYLLYNIWDNSYSIYVSPFYFWTVDKHAVYALIFRLLIGGVGGVAFISLSRILINLNGFGWIKAIAKYGRYTLMFYTMSFVLNVILSRVMWHIDSYITTPGILDVLAFSISAIMMAVIYFFQIVLEKNKLLSRLFLGI